MLFRQEDLNTYDPIQEAADILNESVYLTEEEILSSPITVPVVENTRLGANVVAYEDVERLAEDYGVDYIDAMQAIAEANEIEVDDLAVSVPEWKIISSPGIVNELANVIVTPISTNSEVYRFCEACVNAILEDSENQEYYENLLLVETAKSKANKKARQRAEKSAGQAQPQPQQPSGNFPAVINTSNDPDTPEHLRQQVNFNSNGSMKDKLGFDPNQILSQAENQPKTWIAKKISSLRGLYQKWLKKANEEKDSGKIGMFKNIARVIMNVIDKLLAKLQNATDKKGNNSAAATAAMA